MFDAYDRQGRAAEGLVLLRGYLRSYPQLELLDVLYPKIAAQHGDAVALEFLRDTVRARPSLTGLGRLIEAQQAGFEPEQRVDAELGRTLVQSHGKRLNVYRCKRCNFRSKVFFWHCPGVVASGRALPLTGRKPNKRGSPNPPGVSVRSF